jgi:serine/alanine adding enzyme
MATKPLSRSTWTARTLSVDDAGDVRLWEALVDSAAVPEVYYRPGYLKAYQAIGHGTALAVIIETRSVRALFPLLLRPLNALPFAPDESGFDAASPYGYGGLLLLDGVTAITAEQGLELLDALRDWCCDNQVISVHVRLHPQLIQEAWFAGTLGEDFQLQQTGPTVALDLNRWYTETASIATLDKGRRSDLNFARRHLRLTWTSEGRVLDEDLQLFRELYELRMTELGASDYYHFPPEYYDALAEGLGHRLDVALAWLNDSPVGAALFMIDSVMAHYHLSATNDWGRTNKATTMIINAAAERARAQGCHRLHLGGGAHGEDKLFAFKRSFGGELCRCSYLSLICDPYRYRTLVERRVAALNLPALRSNYFPEYRA